jgi:hypothetical protein
MLILLIYNCWLPLPSEDILRKKNETKTMRKEFNLVQREAIPSEGFQKMELKLLNTLHLHFIEQEIVSAGAWFQQTVEINK